MKKGKNQRIIDSFHDASKDDVSKYLDWLRATLEDLSQGIRRLVLLMLLLAAAFELVIESPRTQLTIGGFVVASNSIVIIFIPAVVAYLYLQAMRDTAVLLELQKVFTDAFGIWSPKADENNLDLWILPTGIAFWNFTETKDISYDNWWIRFMDTLQGITTVAVIMLPPAFAAQAYYILHQRRVNASFWHISLIASGFFTVQALGWFIAKTKD